MNQLYPQHQPITLVNGQRINQGFRKPEKTKWTSEEGTLSSVARVQYLLSTAPCHPRCPSNHFAPSLPSAAPRVDALLRTAVAKHDGKNWKSISMFLQGKSEVQVGCCFSRALPCAVH